MIWFVPVIAVVVGGVVAIKVKDYFLSKQLLVLDGKKGAGKTVTKDILMGKTYNPNQISTIKEK